MEGEGEGEEEEEEKEEEEGSVTTRSRVGDVWLGCTAGGRLRGWCAIYPLIDERSVVLDSPSVFSQFSTLDFL